MFDPAHPGPDYTLRWPPELFTREARYFVDQPQTPEWAEDVGLLLEEAFVTTEPLDEQQRQSDLDSAFIANPDHTHFLRKLIDAAPNFPRETDPRPYYPIRHFTPVVDDPGQLGTNPEAARRGWTAAVNDLHRRGYLDRVAPRKCVDLPEQDDPDDLLNSAITERLGPTGGEWRFWPLDPARWNDNAFYGLVEVFHDLVSRPRHRRYHSYNNCGWHYDRFAVDPAQILYRWTVNRILAQYGINLRLAKSGEDVGRLVQTAGDAREELVLAAIANGGSSVDPIRHAVALYRARDADVESKRSACIALFGVLESRRELLKAKLLTKDEGALFEIANKFGIRHQKANQQGDYDEIYLDWIFWWCLATVELTNRLLTRAGGSDD